MMSGSLPEVDVGDMPASHEASESELPTEDEAPSTFAFAWYYWYMSIYYVKSIVNFIRIHFWFGTFKPKNEHVIQNV